MRLVFKWLFGTVGAVNRAGEMNFRGGGFQSEDALTVVDVATFRPLFFADPFRGVSFHMASLLAYKSYFMDTTMRLNTPKWELRGETAADELIASGTVNLTDDYQGIQTPPDLKGRLRGHFIQTRWSYNHLVNPLDEFGPRYRIDGKDTDFGCNYIGDNLDERPSTLAIANANVPFPAVTVGGVPYTSFNYLAFVQSLNPISKTTQTTPPRWAFTDGAAVEGTLYHSRSKRAQKRYGY